jgi:hypothetical protein
MKSINDIVNEIENEICKAILYSRIQVLKKLQIQILNLNKI